MTEKTERAIRKSRVSAENTEWYNAALTALGYLARTQPEIIADDVWDVISNQHDFPAEPRVMGAVMRYGKTLGFIEPTSEFRLSAPREWSHTTPRRVWRSKVYSSTK